MSSSIPLIPDFFIKRIEKWADKRQNHTHHSAIIDHRHLYIVPSKTGVFFIFILFIIFIGAINYENSMAFLLCFLLTSIALICMIYTHLNIKNIQLETTTATNVFAEQNALFPITLKHTNLQNSVCIYIEADGNPAIEITSLKPAKEQKIKLAVKTTQRGYQTLPRIKVHTLYPLGLFYAWSWINISSHCLVYPKPAKNNNAINNTEFPSSHTSKKTMGEDDFDHLRSYQEGDNPAHIAWKAYARSAELFTKTFQASAQKEIWLDWFNLNDNFSKEEKLSILCKQILDADHKGLNYGLKLPQQKIACGNNSQHREHCLSALALC